MLNMPKEEHFRKNSLFIQSRFDNVTGHHSIDFNGMGVRGHIIGREHSDVIHSVREAREFLPSQVYNKLLREVLKLGKTRKP